MNIPSEHFVDRFVFGTLRNPWAWYASWFQHSKMADSTVFRQLRDLTALGNGSSEFRDVLYSITHPEEVTDLPQDFGVVWGFHPSENDHRPSWLRSGVGLCTWTARYTYGYPPSLDALVDTSCLYEALGSLLGGPLDPDKYPPFNMSKHRPPTYIKNPQSLYDEEMVEWVRKADREVIDLMGYPGPFQPAKQPILYLET